MEELQHIKKFIDESIDDLNTYVAHPHYGMPEFEKGYASALDTIRAVVNLRIAYHSKKSNVQVTAYEQAGGNGDDRVGTR